MRRSTHFRSEQMLFLEVDRLIPSLPLRVLYWVLNCFLKKVAIFQASIAFQGISPVV